MAEAGDSQHTRDRAKLLTFILKSVDVTLPPGVASVDSLDLNHISIDDVLSSIENDVIIDLTAVPLSPAAASPPPLPPKQQSNALPEVVPIAAVDAEEEDEDDDVSLGEELPRLGNTDERDLPLERDQVVLLAYETLLLCCGVASENPVELDSDDKDSLRTVRTQLGLGSKSHARALKGLQVDAGVSTPVGYHGYLGYRLTLVQQRRPGDYDTWDQFKEWHYRQCVLLSHTLNWWLRHVNAADAHPDVTSTFQELIDVVNKFTDAGDFEKFCGQSYTEQTQQLSDWAKGIYATLAKNGIPNEDGLKLPIAYPVNMELYSILLEAQFDQTDPGKLLPGKDSILRLFRHVRQRLCVSSLMAQVGVAKLAFHIYATTEDRQLLEPAMEYLDNLASFPSPDPQCPAPNPELAKVQDGDYRSVSLMEIVDYARDQLGDYRSHYAQQPDAMGGLLSCLPYVWDLAEPNVKHGDSDVLKACIDQSVKTHYDRCIEDSPVERPFDMRGAAQFTNNLVVEVETDIEHFAPVFKEFLGTATADIVAAYVKCLCKDYTEVFAHESEMNQDTVDLAVCLGYLEEKLEPAHKDMLNDVYALFMVPIHNWVVGLQQKYITAVRRMVQMERWEPVTEPPCHSSSVVDMFAMWNQQVPLFFNFKIPGAVQFVNSLAMTIDEVVQSYAMALVKSVGDKQVFIPPVPGFSMSKTKFGGLVKKQEVAPFLAEQEVRRLSHQTVQQLFCRLNNLVELPRKLKALQATMEESFEEVRRVRPDAGPSLVSLNLFESSYAVCQKSIATLCEYIGYKVVYFDMRNCYLDHLYVPSAKQSRLSLVLDQLDPILGLIMEYVYDGYTKRVIAQLFKAFLEVYRRILLDGGKDRIFTVEDTRVFEEDITAIQEFFVVEKDEETGECLGLPDTEVEKWTNTLHALLMVFETSTDELIEQYAYAPNTDPHNPMVRGNIFRVLVHRRNDKVATKWVHAEKKRLGVS